MTRNSAAIYRGYEGSCIYGDGTRIFYGHVINVRESMIAFRFRRIGDFGRALRIAVDAYCANCRLVGLKPEKPAPLTKTLAARARPRA
jgi:predicted HicB family RNase H-like nuclease